MKHFLIRLATWLQDHRREYYDSLHPGLSDADIRSWETKFGFEFPEEFKQLYQWKNGQPDENREYLFDFFFFDEMAVIHEQWEMGCEDLSEFNVEGSMAWGGSWLRFLSQLDGNGYCLDVHGDLGNPGQIISFAHDGDNHVACASLTRMIEMILSLLEQGVYAYKENNDKDSFVMVDEETREKIYAEFMM
ncbi:MAG: SMI1/KNR4 family protein [Bacteroidota bacterium]